MKNAHQDITIVMEYALSVRLHYKIVSSVLMQIFALSVTMDMNRLMVSVFIIVILKIVSPVLNPFSFLHKNVICVMIITLSSMVFVNQCAKFLLLAEGVFSVRIILLMKMVFVCFAAHYSMIVQCVMKTHAFRGAHKNAGPALVKLTRIVSYVLTAIIC